MRAEAEVGEGFGQYRAVQPGSECGQRFRKAAFRGDLAADDDSATAANGVGERLDVGRGG